MSELDEQIDKVVDELWKISEPYPTYSIRATKAIKALIADEVKKARIEELKRVKRYAGAWFRGDERLVKWVHIEIVVDRIKELEQSILGDK